MITGRSGVRLPLGQPVVCAVQAGTPARPHKPSQPGSTPGAATNGSSTPCKSRLVPRPTLFSRACSSVGRALGSHPGGGSTPLRSTHGFVAQLGERRLCKPDVASSTLAESTIAFVVQRKNALLVWGRPWVRLPPRAPFAGVAEWLGPGLPTQSREFDSRRPLQVECSVGSTSLVKYLSAISRRPFSDAVLPAEGNRLQPCLR